jgi:hypothetical protein
MLWLASVLLGRDAAHLRLAARAAGVDERMVLAVAYVETRRNLDPRVLDQTCAHISRDCAVGRFQIKPSTARLRCPEENIRTYKGNVACFLKMFRVDVAQVGPVQAVFVQNHGDQYVRDVFAVVGVLSLEGL